MVSALLSFYFNCLWFISFQVAGYTWSGFPVNTFIVYSFHWSLILNVCIQLCFHVYACIWLMNGSITSTNNHTIYLLFNAIADVTRYCVFLFYSRKMIIIANCMGWFVVGRNRPHEICKQFRCVVWLWSYYAFVLNSYDFINHISQSCFISIEGIVYSTQHYQSNLNEHGKINRCRNPIDHD